MTTLHPDTAAAERYAATLRPYSDLTAWAGTLPVGHRGGYPDLRDHIHDATLLTLLNLLHRVSPEDVAAAAAEARDYMTRQAARRAEAGRVTS